MNACEAYLEGAILAAGPVELVELLYRTALESVRKARQHLRQGDIRSRSRQITRAMEVLGELALSLNHTSGGALSRNLAELYDYMQRQLAQANFQQADSPLAEVEALLGTLLDAWLAINPSSGPARAPASPAEISEHAPVSCTC